MPLNYTKRTWVNGSSPAISAANLQAMDDGIKQACDARKRANRYQKRCWQNGKKSGIESMSYRSK